MCRHLRAVPRIFLTVGCLWVLVASSFLGMTVAHREVFAEEPSAVALTGVLRVVPERISVSMDYPAHLVAVTESNGTATDVSRTSQLRVEIPIDLPIQWNATRQVLEIKQSAIDSANGPQLPISGQVTVRFGELSSTVDVQIGSLSSQSPVFPREITALMGKSGCNLGTCHGSLHGKGGFRLSLRGDDPLMDFATIVRGDAVRRIDPIAAGDSLLIKKPAGLTAHQGGIRFAKDSPEAILLKRWIEEGCRWNAVTDASPPATIDEHRPDETLTRLSVVPAETWAASSARDQQLVVIAEFADGTSRDVTDWSRFEPSEATGVSVSSSGLVHADRPIDTAVSIAYLNGRTAARLTFLPASSSTSATENTTRTVASPLDERIDEQLARMQLQAMPAASDSVFLRRVYLVTIGRLPTAEEARNYLNDATSDKRERLVDRLLNDRGYAVLWALRWSDLLRNEQKVMSPEGAAGWHRWMADQIANDRPLTEFAAELVSTVGSTYEHPPASFHRTHRDPETAAETIGQVFLGVRLQCARCHNHPFDVWKQDDYYGLAAYFTTIERKQVENSPKDQFDKHIISGDEIISLAGKAPTIMHPGRAEQFVPKPLGIPFVAQSERPPEPTTVKPLKSLSRWLTQDNRRFARNMANRIWYHVMGRGIVDPPDDFRDSNPASNPQLLEYLTDRLIAGGYSTRTLTREILLSQAFSRASAYHAGDEQSLNATAQFAGYPLHRMPAEILLDAVCDVTGVADDSVEKGIQPATTTAERRAVYRSEVPSRAGFLTAFGKPNRLLVCECERSSDTSLGQSLILVNGVETRDKLSAGDNQLARLLKMQNDPDRLMEELVLTALTRMPTAEERAKLRAYFDAAADRRAALEDILWALLNSKEFVLIQ
ncbi:MAG: DUF1549 and DUF1553 domain-containing protein [Pirellulales bacterium]